MGKKEKVIDAYISRTAAFAQPILNHLRALVHKACPQVEEKMKWSFPHFDYKGGMMCSMAAFKQHAVFGFWKAALMKDGALLEKARSEEAMKLNEPGIKLPSKPKLREKKEVEVPDYFTKVMAKNKKSLQTFEASPTHTKKNIQNG